MFTSTMSISTKLIRVFAMLAITTTVTAVRAECIPISSLPYVISQSGSYCLTSNLSISLSWGGDAINIKASNVDLDFQGHTLTNTSTNATGYSVGVSIDALDVPNINNVTVHNGTVTSFSGAIFGNNVQAGSDAYNLTVDQMRAWFSKNAGIVLNGRNLTVTNNQIIRVTGGDNNTVGIQLTGNPVPGMPNRAVIRGNVIRLVGAKATATLKATASGIAASNFSDILIRSNIIRDIWVPATASDDSRAVGIMIKQMNGPDQIGGLLVQDNTVASTSQSLSVSKPNSVGVMISFPGDHAIVTGSSIDSMTTGIDTSNASSPNTPVLLLNNTINGAAIPINGGVTLPL